MQRGSLMIDVQSVLQIYDTTALLQPQTVALSITTHVCYFIFVRYANITSRIYTVQYAVSRSFRHAY